MNILQEIGQLIYESELRIKKAFRLKNDILRFGESRELTEQENDTLLRCEQFIDVELVLRRSHKKRERLMMIEQN